MGYLTSSHLLEPVGDWSQLVIPSGYSFHKLHLDGSQMIELKVLAMSSQVPVVVTALAH